MNVKGSFQSFIHQLQNDICEALETADGKATFSEDRWERKEGGGGLSRVIQHGAVFEKGGVNTSVVNGKLPEVMQKALGVKHEDFMACGISVVIHPESPMVPTVHANFRYFELYDKSGNIKDQWFGGGTDLTPYYIFEGDIEHFHNTLKKACDPFGKELYPSFQKQCDGYFFNHHRNEPRGIGGIFYDYLRATDDYSTVDRLNFSMSCGKSFLNAYLPIVKRRVVEPYGEQEKFWQEIRRGRYVEFNLLHDRGTLFGLKTNGRIESILMSLPPRVRWEYNYTPEKESREEELLNYLKKQHHTSSK